MKSTISRSLLIVSKLVGKWLPLISALSGAALVINYVAGFFYAQAFFVQFNLDIGDFFTGSDYAALTINRPIFLALLMMLFSSATLIGMLAQRFATRLKVSESGVLRALGLVTTILFSVLVIVPASFSVKEADLIKNRKGPVFDVYLTDGAVVRDCGFIAATTKYYFCYDFSKKLPVLINSSSVTRLVMTMAAYHPPVDPDYPDAP